MLKEHDIVGKIYGQLTVLSIVRRDNRHIYVMCSCSCGVQKVVRFDSIKSGSTVSCNCRKGKGISHGMSKTQTYEAWHSMNQRCKNPNLKAYKNYGERGITVCDRWFKFENFLEDMGVRPEGLSLERINNEEGYNPQNCKWATTAEQNRNKRDNVFLTFQGETKIQSVWAAEKNMSLQVLWNRLYVRNWSVDKALSTPVRLRRKRGINVNNRRK